MKLIEQNWKLPALGNGAADASAGSLMPMFDFSNDNQGNGRVFLDTATGEPISFSSWSQHFSKQG